MNTHPFGVTGPLASGKSHVLRHMKELFAEDGHDLGVIAVDELRRSILYAPGNEAHRELRRGLMDALEIPAGVKLDGIVLGNAIFYDGEKMRAYRALMNPILREAIGEAIGRSHGFVAVEWAMLREDGFADLVGGRIIALSCSPEEQRRRLADSDIPRDQLERRIAYQDAASREWRRAGQALPANELAIDTSRCPPKTAYKRLYEQLAGAFAGQNET